MGCDALGSLVAVLGYAGTTGGHEPSWIRDSEFESIGWFSGTPVRSSNQILFVGGPRSSPPGWKIEGVETVRTYTEQTKYANRTKGWLHTTHGAPTSSPISSPFLPSFIKFFHFLVEFWMHRFFFFKTSFDIRKIRCLAIILSFPCIK